MYTIIYHETLEKTGLKAEEYIILDIFIKDYNKNKDHEGYAEPGKVAISRILNKTYVAVNNDFKKLVTKGWLEEKRINNDNIKYRPAKQLPEALIKDRIEIYSNKKTNDIIEVVRKEHLV